MFSSRVLSFFLLLVSFGLYTSASPLVKEDGLSVRSLLPDVPAEMADHLERRGGWPRNPCHCDHDFKDVIVSFHETVKVHISELDGHKSCGPIFEKIIAHIKATFTLVEKITINGCTVTVVIKECIDIIVEVIVSICHGVRRYNIAKISVYIQQIAEVHVSFLQGCAKACPHIWVLIKESLKVQIDVVSVLGPFCKYLGF